jgi:hypothetical protein
MPPSGHSIGQSTSFMLDYPIAQWHWASGRRRNPLITSPRSQSKGYRSFVGFNPAKKEVVVLCNTFLDNDDLGLHVLEIRYPVASLPK